MSEPTMRTYSCIFLVSDDGEHSTFLCIRITHEPKCTPRVRWPKAPPNFTLKLVRPGFGQPAEPAAVSPARRRHGGCSSAGVACNFSPATAVPLQLRHAGLGRTA